MRTPIPSLPGTPTHEVAVVLYQGHHGGAGGACVRCGELAPCSVRTHAASVIAAAGEDPRWYDGRLSPPTRAADPPRLADRRLAGEPDFGQTYPDHCGYAVGGRSVPLSPGSFLYERDQ